MKLGSTFNVRYSSANETTSESIRIEANSATETETVTGADIATSSLSEHLVDGGTTTATGDEQRWKPLRNFWSRLQKVAKPSTGTEPLIVSQSLPATLLSESPTRSDSEVIVASSRSDLDLKQLECGAGSEKRYEFEDCTDLNEFEDIESAVDCLEEMPDLSSESVRGSGDDDFVLVNNRCVSGHDNRSRTGRASRAPKVSDVCDNKQFLLNLSVRFMFRFFRRHSSILKHILLGIGLSIAAYFSLVFVFGLFAGIVFLVVFGPVYFYADRTRARYEKRTLAMKRQFAAWSSRPAVNSPRTYETWLRLYPELSYDPATYHVSRTLSIFVKLHGSKLSVAFTPYRMSTKMMSSTMAHKLQSRRVFCHSRLLDLRSYDIFLLPGSLKRERIWNKKYPICLRKKRTSGSDMHGDQMIDDLVHVRAHKKHQAIGAHSVDLEEDDLGIYHDQSYATAANHEKLVYETLQEKIDETDGMCASSSAARKPIKCHHSTYHRTNTAVFFVFAKTNREKESLYRRFVQASGTAITSPTSKASKPAFFDTFLMQTNRWRCPSPSSEDSGDDGHDVDANTNTNNDDIDRDNNGDSNDTKPDEIEDFVGLGGITSTKNGSDVAWLNALTARLFYQYVNDTQWIAVFEQIIQKKLDALKMVNFMDDIRISGLNFGPCAPRLTGVFKPLVDDDGLWLDFAVDYSGFVSFTLATKLNLIRGLNNISGRKDDCGVSQTDGMDKFESDSSLSNDVSLTNMTALADGYNGDGDDVNHDAAADDDDDIDNNNDSVESSTDDDFPDFPVTSNPNFAQTVTSPTRGRRFIDFMDKVTASKYFQNAKEYKYVRRAIDGLANTELKLEISLMKLTGVLVVHVPNPLTNRLWYGFRENPELVLSAKPAVGERAINIFQITSWIEKRLCQEFQKYFVLPNMEDLEVPFLDLEKFPALFEN